MVDELSDDFSAESLNKNHITTAEVYLPVTDATPAIQSALQNLRQQYNLTYQKQLDNEVNCSQLLNSSAFNNTTYVPPKFYPHLMKDALSYLMKLRLDQLSFSTAHFWHSLV